MNKLVTAAWTLIVLGLGYLVGTAFPLTGIIGVVISLTGLVFLAIDEHMEIRSIKKALERKK